MYHLPHLVDPSFEPHFCPLQPGLTQIDCVSQYRTTRMDPSCIRSFLQFHTLPFQEFAQMTVNLVLTNLFHGSIMPLSPTHAITHPQLNYNLPPVPTSGLFGHDYPLYLFAIFYFYSAGLSRFLTIHSSAPEYLSRQVLMAVNLLP